MPRLPLLLCAIAVLASAVSAVLFFRIGNSKQLLELQLADAQARATRLEADLAQAHQSQGALKDHMRQLSTDLETVTARVTAADVRVTSAEGELAGARSVVELYEETARGLADDVRALREELAESRSSNASPDAVAAYQHTIATLERQLAAAQSGTATLNAPAASTAVFTNRAGRATVLSVGPESAFVVLNFGTVRGAKLGQRLAVNQGTIEVATVSVSDVRANFSVAQVLPESLRGILQKGDSAVLLR